MKRYLAFILSFALLYMAFQLLTGWFLTVFYTPDLSSIDSNSSQEVVFAQTSSFPLFISLLTATLAYLFSIKLFKT